ncbi:PREDICTED: TBC1 domain family member 25, partial [Ficedula albicollis]|uniref:TBC1 domain family member 25 n=1 Tax=Ficedula albicollis TaxID=59894 RepID=UPI0007AD828D
PGGLRDPPGPPGTPRDPLTLLPQKNEGQQPPEFRSFAVDPQITSLDVLQHILARAFDLQGKKSFVLSFAARDGQGQDTFVPLLSDGDLANAFTCARPTLRLRLDVRNPPDSPLLEDWDIISPREVAAAEPIPERRSLLAAALPFTQALLAQVSTPGPLLEDWDIISPREVAAAEPIPERRSLLAAALPFTQALLAQVCSLTHPYSPHRDIQEGPKSSNHVFESPRDIQEDPKSPRDVQNGPKSSRDVLEGPKDIQEGLKGSNDVLEGSKRSRDLLKSPNDVFESPRDIQEDPKSFKKVQEGPESSSKVSKGPKCSRDVQNGPKSPRDVPNGPKDIQEGPKSFKKIQEGPESSSKVPKGAKSCRKVQRRRPRDTGGAPGGSQDSEPGGPRKVEEGTDALEMEQRAQSLCWGAGGDPREGRARDPRGGHSDPRDGHSDPRDGRSDPRDDRHDSKDSHDDPKEGHDDPGHDHHDPKDSCDDSRRGHHDPRRGHHDLKHDHDLNADPKPPNPTTPDDPWGGRWAWEDPSTSSSSSCSSSSSSSSDEELALEDDGAPLPPPEELGQGNPFLLFVCLAMLLEQRDAVMARAGDYNEVAMHFDRLGRRHCLPRVLRRAKALFARYLEGWGAPQGAAQPGPQIG